VQLSCNSDTWLKFKVCKSVHLHTIQINQPTRWNNFSNFLLDVYVQLNMFRASSRPSSVARQLQKQPLVLPLERGGSSVVGRGPTSRNDHDQLHCYHHSPMVKPESATAIVEHLMMGVRTPETCWAVNKRQTNNWRTCCIWLVDSFEIYWKLDVTFIRNQ
jgi:hypothetical protein